MTLIEHSSLFSLRPSNCFSFCQSFRDPTPTTIRRATIIATPSTQSTGGSPSERKKREHKGSKMRGEPKNFIVGVYTSMFIYMIQLSEVWGRRERECESKEMNTFNCPSKISTSHMLTKPFAQPMG
jgi:hypothetical protein